MKGDIIVEREIGNGDSSVYVYYFPSNKNTKGRWPCKIGSSGNNPKQRIKVQQASMVEKPVIGLLIWTQNSRCCEAIIHNELDDNKLDSFGKEWFYTTPEEVEEIYNNGSIKGELENVIKIARSERGWSQKELGEKSGLRQETISIIENGTTNSGTISLKKVINALGKRIVLEDKD